MNLLTQKALAELAGVSSPAITKARKKERLEYYQGTKEYDIDSPLNKAFLSTIPKERLNKLPSTTVQTGEKSKSLEKAEESVLNATQIKIVEEAEFKKQQRLEKQLRNAVLMGQQVKLESINTMIMTWFDQWLNTNKRKFNGSVDEFLRLAFQLFENEKGDANHDISRATFNRKWSTSFEEWQSEGNEETIKRLSEIQEEQGKG